MVSLSLSDLPRLKHKTPLPPRTVIDSHRDTSLTRRRNPLSPYSRPIRRPVIVVWGVQGYLAHEKTSPPLDSTVDLCLWSCYGPKGGRGVFLKVKYPCRQLTHGGCKGGQHIEEWS